MTPRRLRARRARASSSTGPSSGASASRQGPRKPDEERKDFLIQARVPRDLDDVLKREARRRRLSVSHLIRNVLEDTFELVDGVLGSVDGIVQESVGLATQVTRDASKIARSATGERRSERENKREARGERSEGESTARAREERDGQARAASEAEAAAARARAFEAATADVYAWNPVVLNRQAQCARCNATLAKGHTGHLGLSPNGAAAPRWLCADCLAAL